jgi:hypothetical protein
LATATPKAWILAKAVEALNCGQDQRLSDSVACRCELIIDPEAAPERKERDCGDWIFENELEWQESALRLRFQ